MLGAAAASRAASLPEAALQSSPQTQPPLVPSTADRTVASSR
jgi:hypothetical protein